MLYVRRPQNRTCGIAAVFLVAVIWPAVSPVGSETPDALTPELTTLWLAPASSRSAADSELADAVAALEAGKPTQALPVLARAARANTLDGYPLLYLGRAQLALNKLDEAAKTAGELLAREPSGYLADAAFWLAADVAEASKNWTRSTEVLRQLVAGHPLEPARATLRLGLAANEIGNREEAIAALGKVYFDYATSPQAVDAAAALTRLGALPAPASADEAARHLARADALYDAGRYTDARDAFGLIQHVVAESDRSHVDLRLAQIHFHLKKFPQALAALRPLVAKFPEAEHYYFSALREVGRHDEYLTRARAFVDNHPGEPLAELTLNNMATHFILVDEDAKAAEVFAELYERFPLGPHADRAAWKAGWWSYKTGDYKDAAGIFESAADRFPHNDYRPAWLYWAARAWQRLGQQERAVAGFDRVVNDYGNSYYGRRAVRTLAAMVPGYGQVARVSHTTRAIEPGEPPANANLIRNLLAAGLYDAAIGEVRKAELEDGATPVLEATMAYALNRKGDLRGGIIRMRRAYPEFLAAGGESLPVEIRRIIFPVDYWDLISRYATAKDLDPYLMAALIAQESTFQPAVRSPAGAIGLMQIMPPTGRQIARKLKIRFTTARLKDPEINVRIGMIAFADAVQQYGSPAAALAAYNAGGTRVTRWLAERQGMDQDEFIDDIPFPETQHYVKRILGTAEDYRALYGKTPPRATPSSVTPAKPAAATPAAVKPAPTAVKKAPAKKAPAKKAPAKKAPAKKAAPTKAKGRT